MREWLRVFPAFYGGQVLLYVVLVATAVNMKLPQTAVMDVLASPATTTPIQARARTFGKTRAKSRKPLTLR